MEEQAKKTVHISWAEAERAEAERERARQTSCRSIPQAGMKLNIVCLLRKFVDPALHLRNVPFNYRLRTAAGKAGASFQTLENQHHWEPEEARPAQFDDPVVGFKDAPQEIYSSWRPRKSAVAIFLGIILLAGVGTLSYSGQSKDYAFELKVRLEAWLRHSVDYLSNLSVRFSDFVDAGSENIRGQKPIRTSADDTGADFRQTSSHNVIAGLSWAQNARAVAPQLSSTNHEPVQPDGREKTANEAKTNLGTFEVVDNSFVRSEPQPNAAIIATLRPGTQVMVESKTGGYFYIHSLNGPKVIGYVHEQDAFFRAR